MHNVAAAALRHFAVKSTERHLLHCIMQSVSGSSQRSWARLSVCAAAAAGDFTWRQLGKGSSKQFVHEKLRRGGNEMLGSCSVGE